ncbi:hypothetical protein M9H77_14730 [Catharanthus roseus]|uniref:Uncharacterized protein n=1 Tax=Catharanthus roseus TaxID=4058 RepID=A0ACC0BP69_CATRO|nr:hypothetical protein M9H77_14730 [Catharanthus roseus]
MRVVISSVAEPLVALPLLHYAFGYRVDKIYRVQGSLKLSFFRVIVIIRFRLTRNSIISVSPSTSSSSLLTVLYNIDGSSETVCVIAVICSGKVLVFLSRVFGIFCCWICSNSHEYEFLPSLGGVE